MSPSIALGLLAIVCGLAAILRGIRLFHIRLAERRAVERLYDLTTREAIQRRLNAPRRLAA